MRPPTTRAGRCCKCALPSRADGWGQVRPRRRQPHLPLPGTWRSVVEARADASVRTARRAARRIEPLASIMPASGAPASSGGRARIGACRSQPPRGRIEYVSSPPSAFVCAGRGGWAVSLQAGSARRRFPRARFSCALEQLLAVAGGWRLAEAPRHGRAGGSEQRPRSAFGNGSQTRSVLFHSVRKSEVRFGAGRACCGSPLRLERSGPQGAGSAGRPERPARHLFFSFDKMQSSRPLIPRRPMASRPRARGQPAEAPRGAPPVEATDAGAASGHGQSNSGTQHAGAASRDAPTQPQG